MKTKLQETGKRKREGGWGLAPFRGSYRLGRFFYVVAFVEGEAAAAGRLLIAKTTVVMSRITATATTP
jgi:hypothetical protein